MQNLEGQQTVCTGTWSWSLACFPPSLNVINVLNQGKGVKDVHQNRKPPPMVTKAKFHQYFPSTLGCRGKKCGVRICAFRYMHLETAFIEPMFACMCVCPCGMRVRAHVDLKQNNKTCRKQYFNQDTHDNVGMVMWTLHQMPKCVMQFFNFSYQSFAFALGLIQNC